MVNAWKAIAKAEYLVWSSRFKNYRLIVLPILSMGLFAWAFLGAPLVMNFVLGKFLSDFELLLSVAFPGLLRSAMFFLFMLVMIGPISNSLEDVRIGHWEIIISNNVRTRDILLGTYLAKIPIFGIFVFLLAPIMITPFAIVYKVSILGQALMYLVILSFALVTLWISNILGTMIQQKLGESPRGNDIAKGLSWIVIILIAIPGMSLIYFMDTLATTMNLEPFLLLPSTWSADLLTWCALTFSEAYIPASMLQNFVSILTLHPLVIMSLSCAFAILVVAGGLSTADKLFSFGAGARSEKIVTIKSENVLLRGIRRILPSRFGILVVSSFKDFGRKLQNVSKLIYALFLSSLLPLLMSSGVFGERINDPLFIAIITMLSTSMMLGIFSGITFGGVGFLDSKDQLWMLKSTPYGDLRFIGARVFSYILLAIPLAFVPATITWILLNQTLYQYAMLFTNVLLVIISAVFVGIGVTSLNPSYDDTKSTAFTTNSISTIIILMSTLIAGLVFGLPIVIEQVDVIIGLLICTSPMLLVGLCTLLIGTLRMYLTDG